MMGQSSYADLVHRLADLVLTNQAQRQHRGDVRAIGVALDEHGGLSLMQQAYYDMAAHIPPGGPDDPHPSIVQPIWDGVGDWRW